MSLYDAVLMIADQMEEELPEMAHTRDAQLVRSFARQLRAAVIAAEGNAPPKLFPGEDLKAKILHLVRFGIQTTPEDGTLYKRLVGGVERELIEQVMLAPNGFFQNS